MLFAAVCWAILAVYVGVMASVLPGVTEVIMVSSIWFWMCLMTTLKALHTWRMRPQTSPPQPGAANLDHQPVARR
jgi:hypothetical protein